MKKLTLYLPEKLYEFVRNTAFKKRIPMNEFIRRSIKKQKGGKNEKEKK